jgi:hypothetical protein
MTYWDISSSGVCLAGGVPKDLFAGFIGKLAVHAYSKQSE